MQTTSIIAGYGEIGKALAKVLHTTQETYAFDSDGKLFKCENLQIKPADEWEVLQKEITILHVSFPYSDSFVKQVKYYQEKFNPKYTVIHSTVPPGTSRECSAVHSPVIGIHPFLESGIRTFTKFLSGEQASNVADYFRRAGLKVYLFDKQETTEVMKKLDTDFYGVCIEYVKEVKRICDKYGIPFEAWSIWTNNYNAGYQKLGYPEFTRPNLVPIMTEIGGHCVGPNSKLFETKFTKIING